jgi:hypothetical protein
MGEQACIEFGCSCYRSIYLEPDQASVIVACSTVFAINDDELYM